MELVSRGNPCGWSLVTIVSRGSSIIAEIQRLSQFIPEDFTFPKTQINHPYAKILLDYEYFGNETEIDNEIERDPEGALYAAHPELQPPTWDDESHLWVDYKGDPVDPQPDPPSYSMYWDEATQTWYWYSDNTPVDPQPDPPETETP